MVVELSQEIKYLIEMASQSVSCFFWEIMLQVKIVKSFSNTIVIVATVYEVYFDCIFKAPVHNSFWKVVRKSFLTHLDGKLLKNVL